MNRSKSHEIFQRAKQLMPGGVNSPARAFGGVGGEPIVFERAEGAYLFDADGNRYIDYIGSWGPMILGHQHPKVVAAVHAALDRAFSFGAPTAAENELAELIVAAMSSIEMVRLVNSGTEATMSAIRLARGFTGREVIVKFAGNYHGHVDSLLVATGSSAATLGVPNSPGVTAGTAKDTIIARYNDVAGLERLFSQHGARIAGVIFEPIVGNMGCILPSPEFLRALRELTHKHGALLIADEVITGFRVAYGGAQSLLSFQADLTTLGKILGGGMPIGAYGGRREIMQHVLPAGKVFQAGTLSGNPVATAAGIATLAELRDNPPYERIDSLANRLEHGLSAAAEKAGIQHAITRVGSMLTLFFNRQRPTDWDSASKSDTARYAKYFWGLLDRGVYMPCSQYEALFVSAAHTEADIDATIAAAAEALASVQRRRAYNGFMNRKKKIRTDFRKTHQGRRREGDLTRHFSRDEDAGDRLARGERLTGKGELTRKRTVVGHETDRAAAGFGVLRDVAKSSVRGRVLSVHGLASVVQADDGRQFRCAVRGLLKDMSTDLRHVVVAGDIVWLRPEAGNEGFIEQIEPRQHIVSRMSRGRQQILVANADQLLIVASAAEPHLKPNLIDRFLVEAERMQIEPVICINKIDLIDPADLMPLVGVYGQMGYRMHLVSAASGHGINRLQRLIVGKESVVVGQSGVGKSSLLNGIEPELGLRVGEVSRENEKGKHTTTVARLIPLKIGGFVVDTPGIRQFQLWDIVPEEVAGLYRDIRPYVSLCRFPNCTHTHEADCAVKDAVADGRLDARRYESYCHLRSGDAE